MPQELIILTVCTATAAVQLVALASVTRVSLTQGCMRRACTAIT